MMNESEEKNTVKNKFSLVPHAIYIRFYSEEYVLSPDTMNNAILKTFCVKMMKSCFALLSSSPDGVEELKRRKKKCLTKIVSVFEKL